MFLENVFLLFWGRCDTQINTTSWDGIGFHIGKIEKCEIQLNGGIFKNIRIRYGSITEGSAGGGIVSSGTFIFENVTGIFYRRQSLFTLNSSSQFHMFLCFARKMIDRYYYWWF